MTNTNILFKGEMEIPYHKTRGVAKPVAKMLNGEIVKIYHSINEAARDNNIYSSNISDVIHGRHSQTHGYQWKYVNYTMPHKDKKSTRPCKIVFEKHFETKTHAAEFVQKNNLSGAKIVYTRNRDKQ